MPKRSARLRDRWDDKKCPNESQLLSPKQGFSLLSVHHMRQNECEIHQINKPQNYAKFHQNSLIFFCFLNPLWPWIMVRLIPKCRVQLYLSPYQVWIKSIPKSLNACQHSKIVVQQLWWQIPHSKAVSGWTPLIAKRTITFYTDQMRNVQENDDDRFCISLTLRTSAQHKRHWRWLQMVDINCGISERLW